MDIGSIGPFGLATNIAYYVTGEIANRADRAKLVLNVNNRATRAAGKQRLVSATSALFLKIGSKPPSGLMSAIQEDKSFSSRQPYGTVTFEIDRGRIETLAVTIKAL